MMENSTAPSITRDYVLAVRRCMRKALVFSGRAGASEYWWWYLTLVIARLLLPRALAALPMPSTVVGLCGEAILLLWFAFTLAAGSRRLHDTDHSAWNILWCLTIIGGLYVLYLLCIPSQPGPNRFGPPEPLVPAAV